MLSAKQAREKTESNQVLLKRISIDKDIKRAIEKGKSYIFVMGRLHAEVIQELKEYGYTLTEQATGMKISW